MIWLSLRQVAESANTTERAIQLAIKRKVAGNLVPWRGASLTIREVHGKGGKSGISYEIAADSLPDFLQLRLKAAATTLKAPKRLDNEATRERDWWMHHLAPLAALKPGSIERGRAVSDFADKAHLDWNNTRCTFAARTVRRQLGKYEKGGPNALLPNERADKGKAKVIVTRQFDTAARAHGLSSQQIAETKNTLTRYIRSLIAGSTSPLMIDEMATAKLNELARNLGLAAQRRTFTVPEHIIRKEAIYKAVARKLTDAKAHKDAMPSIKRTIDGMLPNEMWFGDVSPVDIIVRRPDGSTATPRLIAFYDAATHRVHLTPVLCSAGSGIRNSDLIQAFHDAVTAWGVPQNLYVDNGTEYNWTDLIGSLLKLVGGRAIHAMPYNARAKGPVEGFFRTFQNGYLSHLPGYIGGNRMTKKVANVGRAPVPFNGSMNQLSSIIATNLSIYNARPQRRGQLKGLSPDDKFRQFIDAGWHRTEIDPKTLLIAFSEEQVRTVQHGRIKFDGVDWYCDELAEYHGKKVLALIPKYQRWNCIPVKDGDGQHIGFAYPETAYTPFDIEGAKESARRGKLFNKGVSALQKDADKLDIQAELESNVIRFLPRPGEGPSRDHIEPSDYAEGIIAAQDETVAERNLRRSREEHERLTTLLRIAQQRPNSGEKQ